MRPKSNQRLSSHPGIFDQNIGAAPKGLDQPSENAGKSGFANSLAGNGDPLTTEQIEAEKSEQSQNFAQNCGEAVGNRSPSVLGLEVALDHLWDEYEGAPSGPLLARIRRVEDALAAAAGA